MSTATVTWRPPGRARRRRGALALLVLTVLLALAGTRLAAQADVADVAARAPAGPAVTSAAGSAHARGGDSAPAYVVIAEGDTLWELLLPLTPAGTDPVAYVAEVVAASGLDPRALRPGTVVRLP